MRTYGIVFNDYQVLTVEADSYGAAQEIANGIVRGTEGRLVVDCVVALNTALHGTYHIPPENIRDTEQTHT